MTAAAAPLAMVDRAAPAAAPRWLPAVFLGLLVLPFHPYWLDFEQVRRGLLTLLVGLQLLLLPRGAGRDDVDRRWLLSAVLWSAVPVLFSGHGIARALADTGPWLCYWLALLWLPALGAALPRVAWQSSIAALLLLTSCCGVLQRLGLGEIDGYGTAGEPVSVFGNLNVAAEFTAVAAAATLALGWQRPRLCVAALAAAGAYLAINGSRSGLVALALPCIWSWFAVAAPWQHRVALLLALLLGAGAGFAVDRAAAGPARTVAAAAAPHVAARSSATIAVRLEIARSCWQMLRDAPWCGHGLGRFAVEYPRYRSQSEIELSSLARQFVTSTGSAHDDWLQLLVEGGLPALLLVLVSAVQIVRRGFGDPARMLPLLAFAALMAVRSPIGNAPCAAVALLLAAGRRDPAAASAPPAHRVWLLRVGGLGLAGVGALPVLTNVLFAPYQRTRDVAALERAGHIPPGDHRVDHLLAQEYQGLGHLDDAVAAIDRALSARPHEPAYRLLRADLLLKLGRPDDAKTELLRAAALDAGDPQLLVQFAAVYFTQHDHEAVVRVLYADPHPRLFASLGERFDEFAALARAAHDQPAERRYLAEACLRRALDSVGARDQRTRALAHERWLLARDTCNAAGLQRDPRLGALIALLALDADDQATADRAAAALGGTALQDWHVTAIGSGADRLRALPSWAPLLPPRRQP